MSQVPLKWYSVRPLVVGQVLLAVELASCIPPRGGFLLETQSKYDF